MRKLVLQVLLLWLVSTTAPAMQQCCEAIAESVPHHDTPAQSAVDTQHAVHEHDSVSTIQATEEHEHCPTVSADDSGVFLLDVTFPGKSDYDASVSLFSTSTFLSLSRKIQHVDNAVWIVNRRSTYLDTLRLRV